MALFADGWPPFALFQILVSGAKEPQHLLESPTASALLGAVVGAVIGALASGSITYLLQAREHHRQDVGRATSAIVKLSRMTSGLSMLRSHIHKCLSEANERGDWSRPNNTFIIPIGNNLNEIELSPDEVAVLIQTVKPSMIGDLLLSEVIFNDLIGVYNRYASERTDLIRTTITSTEGGSAVAEAGGSEGAQLRVRTRELEDLASALVQRVQDDFELCYQVSVDASEACRLRFGKSFPPLYIKDHSPKLVGGTLPGISRAD